MNVFLQGNKRREKSATFACSVRSNFHGHAGAITSIKCTKCQSQVEALYEENSSGNINEVSISTGFCVLNEREQSIKASELSLSGMSGASIKHTVPAVQA